MSDPKDTEMIRTEQNSGADDLPAKQSGSERNDKGGGNAEASSASQYRAGFIALIGRPNAGKSTLMNRLIGIKVAITSDKPQTTRGRIRTVITDETCQMVFLDSPGIHTAKNRLGERMMRVADDVRKDADVICFLIDARKPLADEDLEIGQALAHLRQNVIIVLNKTDELTKEVIEQREEAAKTAFPFADCVSVSARKGDHVEILRDMIRMRLPFGEPFFEEDTLTDMPEREIVAEIIREKALRCLSDEVPHGIAVVTEKMRWRERTGGRGEICDIDAVVICEKNSHKGIVIGKNGRMLKAIGSKARADIEKLLECDVNLKIFVKVRENWRDDVQQLKNFGLWTQS